MQVKKKKKGGKLQEGNYSKYERKGRCKRDIKDKPREKKLKSDIREWRKKIWEKGEDMSPDKHRCTQIFPFRDSRLGCYCDVTRKHVQFFLIPLAQL
jgi:hypothetical protein